MNKRNEFNYLKMVIVTYDYFPDNSPNTYRWHNVLKQWADDGHEIYVVSAQKSSFHSYEVVDGIKIYRTGRSWFEILKSKFSKTISLPVNDNSGNTIFSKASLIKRIYDATFKQVYFPDFAFLWRNPAKKLAISLIKENNINNLITVSWPFTDHIIGYQLQKSHNINWIADTIDPFYLSDAVNNRFLYKKLNRALEGKVLSRASAVTVLTQKLKDKYIELYPSLKNKVFVNHNIFIPYPIGKTIRGDSKIIKLVFFGTLNPKSRSPLTLLHLMDKLQNIPSIELHIYGDTNQCNHEFECFKSLMNKNVFIHGLITKEQVEKFGQSADVLVNIGNSNEYQEPSKLIEYIYMQKPILNICSITNDSAKEILKSYPLNFNFYKTDLADDNRLNKLIKFIESDYTKPFQGDEVLKYLEKYLLFYVADTYFKLLK